MNTIFNLMSALYSFVINDQAISYHYAGTLQETIIVVLTYE